MELIQATIRHQDMIHFPQQIKACVGKENKHRVVKLIAKLNNTALIE